MASEFSTVVAAGKGWTRVRTADGQEYTLRGARNWRNNNPGNIEYGPFAQSMGAIGSDGRFAVFPSYDAGRNAKSSLLFNSPRYNTKTIEGAISKYAPPTENNTTSYVNRVARALGLAPDTPISSLNPEQQNTMMDAMQRVEGFRVGKAFDAQGNIVDPSALQSNQTTGIMQAINNAPTPEPRPEQGILAAYAQPSGAIERRDLPPVSAGLLDQPTPSTATAFADPRGPNWENPFATVTPQQETPPSMSIADQYASYGAGRAAPLQAGLLSEDVAYQRMIDGLNSQKQQLQAGVNPMDSQQPWTQPAAQPVTTQPAPQEVTQVQPVEPVSYEQTASVPGLLSPEEQRMFEAQRLSLVNAPVNHRPQVASAVKGILGTVGGGILGGLLAGPLGAIGGGLLGKSVITPGGIGNRDFPKKPNSKSRGDGRLTEYGRSVRDSSDQFDRAMDQGGVGLY